MMIKVRVIFIMMATLMCLILIGCGSNEPAEPAEPAVTELAVMGDGEVRYSEMIPDPKKIFTNGEITITDLDGGKAYIFNVTNFTEDEYASYVAECKTMGFNDISYEASNDKGKDFGAYSLDRQYWVQVNLDSSKDTIYVICQESKKK